MQTAASSSFSWLENHKGFKSVKATDSEAWRQWLEVYHQAEQSIWLVIFKKESMVSSVYYAGAVDEALCFGWVDSTPNKRDEQSYYVRFAKRNPKSNWSGVNKQKVAKLIEQGKMHSSGLEMVRLAMEIGTWDALNEVEALIEPSDLKLAFDNNFKAYTNWMAFSPSSRRGILEWIYNAKQAATRSKRIAQTVALAAQNIRANFPLKA